MVVAWKNDPVTKEVLGAIHSYREEAKEYLAIGATLGSNADPTTDEVVGKCKAYEQMLDIMVDLRTIDSEETDD